MRYAKFVVAVLTAVATALTAAVTDGEISAKEWVLVLLAVLGAIGVYAVPNAEPAPLREQPTSLR